MMQVTMGTSPAESLAAAGNIFLGNVMCNSKQQELTFPRNYLLISTNRASVFVCPSDRRCSPDLSVRQWTHHLRDTCCDDWWLCQHLWYHFGSFYLPWGEENMLWKGFLLYNRQLNVFFSPVFFIWGGCNTLVDSNNNVCSSLPGHCQVVLARNRDVHFNF